MTTEDGSQSIRDDETGELHHNRAGAYTEALVNYIQPSGVMSARADELHVLDVCFGAGYNTFTLMSELCREETARYQKVVITAIEASLDVLAHVEQILAFEKFKEVATRLNVSTWLAECRKANNETSKLRANQQRFHLKNGCDAELKLFVADVRLAVPHLAKNEEFDIVFHDPFSPKRMPELWTIDLFLCYRKMLERRRGKVLTYSAASAVRGGLREARFTVGRSTALGGKSGGTVGSIGDSAASNEFVFPLSEEELTKCRSASGIPYRDETFESSREEIQSRRRVEQLDFNAQARL
ncbi:MAG TPA: MnmC family methyltransferase [Planktothrix sp.]